MAIDKTIYKYTRFQNNLEKGIFKGEGKYNIPIIYPEEWKPVTFMDFSRANQCREYEGKGVHFFLDDYQFERIWNKFERNVNMLAKFDAVLSPDWSMFTDWPEAVCIWNHYRKHYVAAYLQSMGVVVYPTIGWRSKNDFDWCFDGEPVGGCVAVGSVGTQMTNVERNMFMYGYDAMFERLQPSTILFYGMIPKGCRGNIVKIEEFQKRLKKIDEKHKSEKNSGDEGCDDDNRGG